MHRKQLDLYGMAWLEQLKREHPRLHTPVVVTSGGDLATHRCALVTDAIEHDHGNLTGWRAYLCGSPHTVVARHKGVAAGHMYADAFYTQGT